MTHSSQDTAPTPSVLSLNKASAAVTLSFVHAVGVFNSETMNPKTTITICDKEVELLYCAATETGFETLSGKPSDVFSPRRGKDEKGNETILPPEAQTGDWITLGVGAIVAAYAKSGTDAPITAEDILYNASPMEVTQLITAVITLRNKWYAIPSVVKEEMLPDKDAKNA